MGNGLENMPVDRKAVIKTEIDWRKWLCSQKWEEKLHGIYQTLETGLLP